jgi:hypothetical protein
MSFFYCGILYTRADHSKVRANRFAENYSLLHI